MEHNFIGLLRIITLPYIQEEVSSRGTGGWRGGGGGGVGGGGGGGDGDDEWPKYSG